MSDKDFKYEGESRSPSFKINLNSLKSNETNDSN